MLKIFMEEANKLSKDVEFANKFYRDLAMKLGLEDESLDNNHKNILDYERKGKTGFDCGWVQIVLSGESEEIKKLIKEIKNSKGLKNSWETPVYVGEVMSSGGEKIYGFQFNFENYGLNVQSTILKHAMNKYFMDELVKKFKELENQYYINTILD